MVNAYYLEYIYLKKGIKTNSAELKWHIMALMRLCVYIMALLRLYVFNQSVLN